MIHTVSHDRDIIVIRPGTERLTAMNAKTFKDEVTAVIEAGSAQLIVDFSAVTFVDSSGLGALVGVLKRIGMRGELAMSGLSADVMQMFKICRMDRVFSIFPTVDAAMQAIEERQ